MAGTVPPGSMNGGRDADHVLRFPQFGRDIPSRAGETIYQSARRAGLRLVGACGGRGSCGSCTVRVLEGVASGGVTGPTTGIDNGVELLACRTVPLGDCVIEVAPRSLARVVRADVEARGAAVRIVLQPVVRRQFLTLATATLVDPSADAERLTRALVGTGHLSLDIAAARELPTVARIAGGAMSVVIRDREIIACAAPSAPTLGVAIDLGTTNIAAFLVDLASGNRVAALATENPQVPWGADLISRVNHALRSPPGMEDLRLAVVSGINGLIFDLCRETGTGTQDVVDVTLCGNTAMQHLFAGLPVDQLARAPFVAAVRDAADIRARDLGIDICRGAYVHVAANIGGFVGGDHVAALLSTEPLWSVVRTAIVMDIGTNTEISLVHGGRIRSASCPSGPALEGGHISCGMRAAEGAIERVRDGKDGPVVSVIGGGPAVGICGSGVLDALAVLRRLDVISERGRILPGHSCVREAGTSRAAQLAPGVDVTQDDVRAVQLAKSAIRTGIETLLDLAGLEARDVETFIIAGAFGAYIDVASAAAIGLVPDLPAERFVQVGNAAGSGVQRMLAARTDRDRAQGIAREAEYVELSLNERFQATFLANLAFPPATTLRSRT